MSFLVDTNIVSAYLKNDHPVVAKVMLHFGGLHISVISVGELMTWAHRANAPPARLQGICDFLAAATIREVDRAVAEVFGELRASLFDQGRSVHQMDLLIASTALIHDLTLVTHNRQDFSAIPGLSIEDWHEK